jgi:muconate cycloisomerase
MPLRIVGIEPILVDVPLREPVQGVHGVTSMQRSVLVRVTSDEGIEGWGDVDPTPGYSAMSAAEIHDTIRRLGPTLAGADPFNRHRALAIMDREAPGRYEAIAGVEMALVDLKARALGLPVHSLLGGRVKDEVTFNAWIGTVPPEQAGRETTGWLAQGFRSAKIKVSGAVPDGIERVAAVRAADPDALKRYRVHPVQEEDPR